VDFFAAGDALNDDASETDQSMTKAVISMRR